MRAQDDLIKEPTAASGKTVHKAEQKKRGGSASHAVAALQGEVGNAAVVQSLRAAGHPWAHRGRAPVVQRVTQKGVSETAARRLLLARSVITQVKDVVPDAGNQQPALERTLLNSRMRYTVMSKPEFWNGVPPQADSADLTMAKGYHVQGGNCSEQAVMAFSLLRSGSVNERIRMVNVQGVDHAFVLIGNDHEPQSEWVVADPWPTKAQACLWEDHYFNADFSELQVSGDAPTGGPGTAGELTQQIGLNPAGKFVSQWSLNSFNRMTGRQLAAMLERNGADIDPQSFSAEDILEGVRMFNDEPLSSIIEHTHATGNYEELSLWCLGEVEPHIVRTLAQSAQEWSPSRELVAEGVAAESTNDPEHEVWNHESSTSDPEGARYHTWMGQQNAWV